MTDRRLRALAVAASSVAALAGCSGDPGPPVSAEADSPLAGIQDPRLTEPGVDAEERLGRIAALGASVVRVDLRWDLVAPRRPADGADPEDPAYRWSRYDRVVAAARRSGTRVLFTVWGTPRWAADPAVPPNPRFPRRAVRPRSAAEYGAFGAAAARRYAPRGVHLWEAWNEPNLPLFLRPQYAFRAGTWEPVSPARYARLLTAFRRRVKGVDPKARVAGGVTAPVGDGCPASCPDAADDRVPPLAFLDGLAAAGRRPEMDAYSHHPYPTSPPRAATPPDVSYIDLYNLDRLVRRLRAGYLADRPLWLSEVGVATGAVPEYPFHVDEGRQAQMLLDAFRRAREEPKVELSVWYLLQDQPTWRSGLLREDGSRKPAAAAFALPVVVAAPRRPRSGAGVELVGQVRGATAPSPVLIERDERGRWTVVARAETSADGTFRVGLRPRASGRYRARWRGPMVSEGPVERTGVPFRVMVEP